MLSLDFEPNAVWCHRQSQSQLGVFLVGTFWLYLWLSKGDNLMLIVVLNGCLGDFIAWLLVAFILVL